MPRTYKVQDETRYEDGPRMILLTWEELAAVNDPEVMEDIALLQVGERTILGMCDPIERIT